MIIIESVTSIDKALKLYKKKIASTKMITELRNRKNFKKKSVKRRDEIKKAIWKESNRES